MKGHFLVCENPNEKLDISFCVRENVEGDIPEEQQESERRWYIPLPSYVTR